MRRVKNPKLRDAALKELEALRRALERADGLEEVFAKHMLPHRNDISIQYKSFKCALRSFLNLSNSTDVSGSSEYTV